MIISGTRSASECSLFLPGHFIMGWFASFWKQARKSATLHCPVKFPPFVIDLTKLEQPMPITEAHHIFWDFDGDGRGLRSLDFLGRSSLRFPGGHRPVFIRDGRTKNEKQPFAISVSAMELLMSSLFGGITHRRGERSDNLVYCPHRFARMFNYDQLIPYFDYRAADNVTDSLNFRSYSPSSRKETLQICVRRHLSYYDQPEGHALVVQPSNLGTRRSYNYIIWCNNAFRFLRDPSFFCDRIFMSAAIKTTVAAPAEGDIDQPAKETAVIKYSLLPGDSEHDREDTTPATVSRLGQGKNIGIIQARLQDKASALTSSPELPLPVDSSQSTHTSKGSRANTDLLDDTLSDGGLACPPDDPDFLNDFVFTGALEPFTDLFTDLPNEVREMQASHTQVPTSGDLEQTDMVHVSQPVSSTGLMSSLDQDVPSTQPGSNQASVRKVNTPKRKAYDTDNLAASDPKSKKTSKDKHRDLDLAVESEQLWNEVEQAISLFRAQTSATDVIGEKPNYSEFDTRQPVHISEPTDVPAPRFMQYAHGDLDRFQRRIRERPFNKDIVISEIADTMKWWKEWFNPAPPKIQRLIDGFNALHETLSENPEHSTTSIIDKRKQVRQKIDDIKASQASVATACSSMISITKSLEAQINLHELSRQQHVSRAEELQAQIKKLSSQLKETEDGLLLETLIKEETATLLTRHNERLAKIVSFQSELEASSVKSQSQLQDAEKTIASFTDQDEEGLTNYVHSLLDFFASCTFRPYA